MSSHGARTRVYLALYGCAPTFRVAGTLMRVVSTDKHSESLFNICVYMIWRLTCRQSRYNLPIYGYRLVVLAGAVIVDI